MTSHTTTTTQSRPFIVKRKSTTRVNPRLGCNAWPTRRSVQLSPKVLTARRTGEAEMGHTDLPFDIPNISLEVGQAKAPNSHRVASQCLPHSTEFCGQQFRGRTGALRRARSARIPTHAAGGRSTAGFEGSELEKPRGFDRRIPLRHRAFEERAQSSRKIGRLGSPKRATQRAWNGDRMLPFVPGLHGACCRSRSFAKRQRLHPKNLGFHGRRNHRQPRSSRIASRRCRNHGVYSSQVRQDQL